MINWHEEGNTRDPSVPAAVAESFNILNHSNVIEMNPFFGSGSSPIPTFDTPNKVGISRQLQFSIDFEL